MPRLSKKEKLYWSFFIDPQTHRRRYHALCRRCTKECKQSFLVSSIICPLYVSKRSKNGRSAVSGAFGHADGGFTAGQKIAPIWAEDTRKSAPFCYTKKEAVNLPEGREMCAPEQAAGTY